MLRSLRVSASLVVASASHTIESRVLGDGLATRDRGTHDQFMAASRRAAYVVCYMTSRERFEWTDEAAIGPEAHYVRDLEVRSTPDTVAKVENRATRKISRKLIFGLLRRCVAFQGHHGGPWSILDETMWSLTSPLAKRISGSKKFRLSPQKDFCNNIPH